MTVPHTLPLGPLSVDLDELSQRGFVTIPGAVPDARIDEFHATVHSLGESLCTRHRVSRHHAEPLIDLFARGGSFREQLFLLLKHLHVVERASLELAERLRLGGLWTHLGMVAPLAWPTLRADPPNEDTYLLPMHQDFDSTRCHTALRGWVPLTPANEVHGTIRFVVGSHKLGYLEHDVTTPLHPRVAPSVYQHLPLHTVSCDPGTLVLIDPRVVHESVPNRGPLMKFVLLLQLQDLATLADRDDPDEPMRPWVESVNRRRHATTQGGSTSDR